MIIIIKIEGSQSAMTEHVASIKIGQAWKQKSMEEALTIAHS